MNVRNFALPAAALAILGAGACAGQTMTVTHTVTETAPAQSPTASAGTAKPSPTSTPASSPSSVPVLAPGQSATFAVGNTASSQVARMTWTMGSHVATVPDTLQGPGYQDIAFNLKIQNEGAAIDGDPTSQSFMVWRGTDGRTDDTLASTAATGISAGTHGITGQDLGLLGGIPANGYATGYVELLVPTPPGAVIIVDPNTNQPVLVINYDKLAGDQLSSIERELRARGSRQRTATQPGRLFTLRPTRPADTAKYESALLADPAAEWKADYGRDTAAARLLPCAGGYAPPRRKLPSAIPLARSPARGPPRAAAGTGRRAPCSVSRSRVLPLHAQASRSAVQRSCG